MILSKQLDVSLATTLVAALLVGGTAVALDDQDAKSEAGSAAPATEEAADEATQSVAGRVQGTTDEVASKRREDLINDAVEALDSTQEALGALDAGDTEAALESLALAIGKLDLVIARNPHMALAPVDVRVGTYDLYASVEAIEEAKEQALEFMEEGSLQDARLLIERLRSEIVVEVANVPLATYPSAIRAITPLIDAGMLEEAKAGLQQALNTLVITEHRHALPVIRAQHMLTRAETLAETKPRSDEQGGELSMLLEGARRQLEIAQALGYGEHDDFDGYYEQLDQIARKTSGGKSETGLFDKIRAALRSFGSGSSTS